MGNKLTRKEIILYLFAQFLASVIFIIGVFTIFNGRNYDISLNQINHGDFFTWIDYRIGWTRWYETRITELGILLPFLVLLKYIPERSWGLLVRVKNREVDSLPLDELMKK